MANSIEDFKARVKMAETNMLLLEEELKRVQEKAKSDAWLILAYGFVPGLGAGYWAGQATRGEVLGTLLVVGVILGVVWLKERFWGR